MLQTVMDFYSNDVMKFFFWGPVFLNALIYPIHIWFRIQNDRRAVQDKARYYSDFITVGSLFKYALLTIVPVINALATIFHAGPIAFDYIAKRFAWLFKVQIIKDTRTEE